jgi:transposase
MVHVSETCEPTAPHLLTHVHTTTAAVHDAQGTTPMQPALAEQDVLPSEHLVDAAYSSAALLVQSQAESGITLRGPTRPSPGWQAQVEGAYTVEHLEVDWAHQRVRCPQGNWSAAWWEHGAQTSSRRIFVESAREDCQAWPARALCTRAQQQGRRVGLPPQAPYEAAPAARAWVGSEEGRQQSQQRAGGEGPLSQGVRGLGLRDARSRGLTTTHVQHVATAAAMNVERIVAWLNERPRAKTRTSRVAALAPACGMP